MEVDMWTRIVQNLLPGPRCHLCQAPATAAAALCRACTRDLPWLGAACTHCGLPLASAEEDTLCGTCLTDPPPFDRALMPFRYAPPIDRLIGALKFRHDLATGALLGQLLADTVAGRTVDCLFPIPLHPARLRERGFNQAAELCRVVARAHDIPWDSHSLQRIRTAPTQHTSSRRERLRNLRGAFAWEGGTPPARVALIDDVMTTGATARAAAVALKRAGVERVEIWAVARTPPPHSRNV